MKKEKQMILLNLEFLNDNIPIETVEENQKIVEQINEIYSLWNDIGVIIKKMYKTNLAEYEGYDGPMQFLNAEAFTTIDTSIILAVHGYYRQGISLLRYWFENSLYGIFFNDHIVEFKQWLYEDNPHLSFTMNFSTDFANYLFKLTNFREFDSLIGEKWKKQYYNSFKSWMTGMYRELSAHIHGRGAWRSAILQIDLEELPRKYDKKHFEFWYYLFRNVFNIITISFLLYNPKLLNRYYVKRKEILDELNPDCVDILIKNFGVKY